MEDLSRFERIGEIIKSIPKSGTKPILPVSVKLGDQRMLVFPWDPDYERFQKNEIPDPLQHGRPSGPGDHSTRLVFREGRWLPHCRSK
jgi:hypothetical protein